MELEKGTLIALKTHIENRHGHLPVGTIGVYSHQTSILPFNPGYMCNFNIIGDFFLFERQFEVVGSPINFQVGDEVYIADNIDIIKGKKGVINSIHSTMCYVDMGFTELAVPKHMIIPCTFGNNVKKHVLERGD